MTLRQLRQRASFLVGLMFFMIALTVSVAVFLAGAGIILAIGFAALSLQSVKKTLAAHFC